MMCCGRSIDLTGRNEDINKQLCKVHVSFRLRPAHIKGGIAQARVLINQGLSIDRHMPRPGIHACVGVGFSPTRACVGV